MRAEAFGQIRFAQNSLHVACSAEEVVERVQKEGMQGLSQVVHRVLGEHSSGCPGDGHDEMEVRGRVRWPGVSRVVAGKSLSLSKPHTYSIRSAFSKTKNYFFDELFQKRKTIFSMSFKSIMLF